MKNRKLHSDACLEAHQEVGKNEGFTCTDNCLEKSKTQHTPTPRDLTITEVRYQGIPRYRILTEFSTREQAEQVVRAVNAHEELLEALKLAERELTDFCDTPDKEGFVLAPDSLGRVSLSRVRNAIAKAEAAS